MTLIVQEYSLILALDNFIEGACFALLFAIFLLVLLIVVVNLKVIHKLTFLLLPVVLLTLALTLMLVLVLLLVLMLVDVIWAGGLPIGLKEGGAIRRLGGGQLELRLKLIMLLLLRGKLLVLDRIWGRREEW